MNESLIDKAGEQEFCSRTWRAMEVTSGFDLYRSLTVDFCWDAPRAHATELSCGPPAIEAILLARLI